MIRYLFQLARLVLVALTLLLFAAPAGAATLTEGAILKALLAYNPQTLARDLPRARTVAAAIQSASLEATCSGPWADADRDLCAVVWPSSRIELAAVLIVQGTRESGFMERIGAGLCEAKECDALRLPGGELLHQARHYWQLHRSGLVPEREWRGLVGVEYHPTANAALAAARVLGAGYRFCRSLEGAIANYARGSGCSWAGAPRRARMTRAVEARLSG